jgi:hypothetical protein
VPLVNGWTQKVQPTLWQVNLRAVDVNRVVALRWKARWSRGKQQRTTQFVVTGQRNGVLVNITGNKEPEQLFGRIQMQLQ